MCQPLAFWFVPAHFWDSSVAVQLLLLLQEVIWHCSRKLMRPWLPNNQSWSFPKLWMMFLAMSIDSWGCRGLPVIVIRDGTCYAKSLFDLQVVGVASIYGKGIIAIRDETCCLSQTTVFLISKIFGWVSSYDCGTAMTVQTLFHKWWDGTSLFYNNMSCYITTPMRLVDELSCSEDDEAIVYNGTLVSKISDSMILLAMSEDCWWRSSRSVHKG